MQFHTRIFVRVRNPGAQIAKIGGYLLTTSFMVFVILELSNAWDSYAGYLLYPFAAGVIASIAGRLIAKGNLYQIGLSDTQLVVDAAGIQIGAQTFPMDHITNLDFLVEGYDGMPTIRRGWVGARRRRPISGANNKIHFRAGGTRYLHQFYLPDRFAMQQLSQVFRTFYEGGIPFRE